MTPCAVTTGFFTLGKCGQMAVAGCPACGRAVCADHLADGGLCPECAAARNRFGHPSAAAAARRRVYRQRQAQYYGDTVYYSSFDDYDRAAFEPGAAADQDYLDDGDDALVDS
ncbi:hypothetical protein FHR83_003743 [Actinoplanes campanulatus]|uniref:Uncharacterized protein n=1 Tax=Actinoplanes campanulatus TaxID=113559 RepID=A0A7W5AGW1_9ACTN|nr:hypothetical protein [Actinoplanes campanulatus]MBB3096073.1 hypothetical protein [Actinoplanes campanulatus]GGN13506.1 hypothetical protein GCM10010109_24570 [Actinoplanes campanulatus]GID36833.1 hypothetical protein Aca09nite_33390 [Actinoplanes campanulatus]